MSVIKEKGVAIDTASLVGDETLYLRYAPIAWHIAIVRNAGALAHLTTRTPSKTYSGLLLGEKNLDAISSIAVDKRGSLGDVQCIVGFSHGQNKRRFGEVGIKQIPVLMLDQVLERAKDRRPKNKGNLELVTFEYLKNKIIKATPKLFAEHNIRTQEDLDKMLEVYNATGFCFDTSESRFLQRSGLFEEVMRRTMLVTVSVFKDDFGSPQFGTIDRNAEGNDLINGGSKTEISRLLMNTKLAGFNGVYVLSFDLSKLPGIQDFIAYPNDIKKAVQPLIDAVKSHA